MNLDRVQRFSLSALTWFSSITRLLVLGIVLTGCMLGQTPLSCGLAGQVPPILRGEGYTEPLADIVIQCAGGSVGEEQLDVNVFLNSDLTSGLPGGRPEVLALVNEPLPGTQSLGLNMFRADLVSAAQNSYYSFVGIRVPPPATGGLRLIRISNLRANANKIGVSGGPIPSQIQAFVTASRTGGGSILSYETTLGYVNLGLNASVTDPSGAGIYSGSLSRCTGLNEALADSASASGGVPTFNLKFSERFASAFRVRQLLDSGGVPIAQSTPGALNFTESMFYDPVWPPTDGLNRIGLATQGTRLMAQFKNVPAGLSIFVTTTPSPAGTSSTLSPGVARLTATDATGTGPFTPVPQTTTIVLDGRTVGLTPLTVQNGVATAVWEVVSDSGATVDPAVIESISFAVVLAHKPDIVSTGVTAMNIGFGPRLPAAPGDAVATPRFVTTSDSDAFFMFGCGTPTADLTPTGASFPSVVEAGSSFDAWAYVKNIGNATAADVRVKGTLFRDQDLTDEVQGSSGQCTIGVPLPGAGYSSACSLSISVPDSLAAARYYLKFVADPNSSVAELREDNNVRESVVDVVVPCRYALSPASVVAQAGGGAGSLSVNTSAGCIFSALSDAAWLTVTGVDFSAPTVGYSIAANSGPTRSGTINVGGQLFTVNQAGTDCTYALSKSTVQVSPASRSITLSVTSAAGCPWQPVSATGWLQVNPGYSGMGQGSFVLAVAANTGASRTASVSISGQTVTILQDQAGSVGSLARIGAYSAGAWRLDVDGNGRFAAADRNFFLGWPGAVQFAGDWDGDGKTEAGVYSEGYWFLDYDGDGVWDGGVNDKLVAWGWSGVTPIVGDWNGDGKTKIGVYSNGFWFLDYNGDYLWDGGVVDKQVGWGWAGVTPLVGD